MTTTFPFAAMTRRRLLHAGASAVFAAATLDLAGCATRDTDAQGRTILRYMAWGNPEQLAVEQQVAEEFEKQNPHVHIHLFMVPGSAYGDKLQLMLASRTAADVMRVDQYIFPSLVRKDYFQPLDEFIAREPAGFLDDFVPTALAECRYKDSLYALSVLFGPVILYYNKALFQQAGVPDPYELDKKKAWDWEAFVQTAQALTTRKNGRVQQFGTDMPNFPQFASIVWNNGGDFMNGDKTRMVLGDAPQSIEGVQKYADLRWKYKCAPTPADAALSPFSFESGKLAMHWDWHGVSPRYRKAIKDFDWDICPTPSGQAGNATVLKGNQICVYRHAKHPEIAWQYVKFMTSPQTEKLLCGKLRRSVPTRKSVQNDPAYLQTDKPPFHTDVFLESVRRGRTLPINARYQEWLVEFQNATDPLFNVNSATAEEVCKEATRRVNTLLASEEGF